MIDERSTYCDNISKNKKVATSATFFFVSMTTSTDGHTQIRHGTTNQYIRFKAISFASDGFSPSGWTVIKAWKI